MSEEQYLRQQLAELQRSYQKACEPIIKRLVSIENMKQPQQVILNYDQWSALQDNEVLK